MKHSSKKKKNLEMTIAVFILWIINCIIKTFTCTIRIVYYVAKSLFLATYKSTKKFAIKMNTYFNSKKYARFKKTIHCFFKQFIKKPHLSFKFSKFPRLNPLTEQRSFLLEILANEKDEKEIDKLLIKKGEHPFLKLVK